MQFALFDDNLRSQLLPFTHIRACAQISCGILTITEKWEKYLNGKAFMMSTAQINPIYPELPENINLYINGRYFPNPELIVAIQNLEDDQVIMDENVIVVYKGRKPIYNSTSLYPEVTKINFAATLKSLNHPWDIFSFNEEQIKQDYQLITNNRKSQALPDYVIVSHPENVFIEEGAIVNPCIINSKNALIYIGKNSEIMEGVLIRGTIAILANAVVKMGAKIYGGTTIGQGCKVGGEIQNAVFFANSNKGHDGYLGNAVIAEWCNIGADTNCSNLKNNYEAVKVWSEKENKLIKTGLQFCGLLMADHSKCGINTMFNTGTVVGVASNIFGGGFPSKFIPSFSWGGSESMTNYKLDKAIEGINNMLSRRNKSLSKNEIDLLQFVFETTQEQREVHNF